MIEQESHDTNSDCEEKDVQNLNLSDFRSKSPMMNFARKENNSDDDDTSLKSSTNRSNMNISKPQNSKIVIPPSVKVNDRSISPIPTSKKSDKNEKKGVDASMISTRSFLSDKTMEEKQSKDQDITIQQLMKENREFQSKISKLEDELIQVYNI